MFDQTGHKITARQIRPSKFRLSNLCLGKFGIVEPDLRKNTVCEVGTIKKALLYVSPHQKCVGDSEPGIIPLRAL
jgi:hypothetical protein